MVVKIEEKPQKLLKRSMLLSLGIGLVLLVVKFSAFWITKSTAILSDALESIIHILPTIIAIYSLKLSFKPPDKKHHFGHGKAEFLSVGIEGGAISVVAIWLIINSIRELIVGVHLTKLDLGLYLIGFAAIINLFLGLHLLRTGKKTDSLILEADGKHILSDVVTSVGVVIGLTVVAFTNWLFLDPIIAILVALCVLRTGYKLVKKAFSGIMDESDPEYENLVKVVLDNHVQKNVCGYHKLRYRKSGDMHYVDFHLFCPKHLSINDAHFIATMIETEIANKLGSAGVMAHIEPCTLPDCNNCNSNEKEKS